MAKISIPIEIKGVDIMVKVLKEFDNRFEFKDDVSEEFKNGFNYCKSIFIGVLEELGDKIE